VSEWGDMSIRGLLFQLANYKNPTKRVGLLQIGRHHHLIEYLRNNLWKGQVCWRF